MHDGFTAVRHETIQSGISLLDDVRKRSRNETHCHLTNATVDLLDAIVEHEPECLRRRLLHLFVGQVELLLACGTNLGQDPSFKAVHGEDKLRLPLEVHAHESVCTSDVCERTRQTLLSRSSTPHDRR